MSAECDLARLVLRKKALRDELAKVNSQVRHQADLVNLPLAIEIEGQVVTIKKPSFGEMPQTSVLPLHGSCG